MDIKFCEPSLEKTFIEKLVTIGYMYNSTDSAWTAERRLDSFIDEKLLLERLRIINKGVSDDILLEAIKQIKQIDNPSLFDCNNIFHKKLIDGITIDDYHSKVNPHIRFVDFKNSKNNIFQVYNQVKFKESNSVRIPDIILFVNGIPLVIIELKSIDVREDTSLEAAYKQLGENSENGGYRYDIPTLFTYNAFLIISDGATSKVGTLTSESTRFNEWKSKDGEPGYKKDYAYKLDVLIEGLLKPERLLDVIGNNLFFMNQDKERPIKILTQYHQYFGVKKAAESVKKNIIPQGDGKAGIVWHTQGSGKSFSMVMLAYKLISDPILDNPTIVVLTDRNDLDTQLFSTFSNSAEYLRTTPIQVESREDLLEKIGAVKEGGIIFSTLQKFDKDKIVPNLRSNIIVLSDEAHRSHYGIDEKIVIKKQADGTVETASKFGYAKYIRDSLPNATFLGFTGTPVNTFDHSTVAIFGEIVDTYDMTQSIEDGSTVKIFYESRLAKVWLDENKLNEVEDYYEQLSDEGASDELINESKSRMSRMELIVGNDDRLRLLSNDIIKHYNERKDILNGKAMIVCMSRKIAYNMYKIILECAPELTDNVVVIVTESNKDSAEERKIFGDKAYRQNQAEAFKKKDSSLKIVIVVDMWLTGFDVTDLDVMYIDKPMKGHNLMQAIARVNRVHAGKESGLIVDYIGLTKSLESALDTYTARDKELNLKDIQNSAKAIVDEKISVLDEIFHKVNKNEFFSGTESERFKAIQNGADYILADENLKKEYLKITKQLKNAYVVSLGVLDEDSKKKILYYISVRHFIQKIEYEGGGIKFDPATINARVEDLIAEAIKGDEVKILTQVKNTDGHRNVWELLSDEKIETLRLTNPPHIFIKIMERLLKDAVAEHRGYNLVKSKEYSERLRRLLEAYNTREDNIQIDLTISELIAFSKEMLTSEENAHKNNLSGRERAFYDALSTNKSAFDIMTDDVLRIIARELKDIVEEYATVDWSKKKNTQAKMRMQIRRLLKEYNYPPDYTADAIERVIDQAEFMM